MTERSYPDGTARRRTLVRDARDEHGEPFLNGIDYVDVDAADQRVLHVHFVHPVPGQPGGVPAGGVLAAANFRVDGGVRVANVVVATLVDTDDAVITLRVDRAGDFSPYTLRLIASSLDDDPPAGFDPLLAAVRFSFKVNCPNDADCRETASSAVDALPAPYLNYLARDYESFRRLLLDRLAATMPDWRDRSPADLGIALVELLAYTGDQLSYFQDAVATEAYLGTARRRTSVRRHGRLVDYHLHDGASARAWLVFETTADRGSAVAPAIRAGTRVVAAGDDADDAIAFETLHTLATLAVARNGIRFHMWGEDRRVLPRGATGATLVGSTASLGLASGDALVVEEVRSPSSGRAEDADRARRHVVRLARDPRDLRDPLTGTDVVDVRWHDADALPFAVCLAEFDDGAGGTQSSAVVRANVVLADHGTSVGADGSARTLAPARVPPEGRYRPVVTVGPLSQVVAYDDAEARGRPAAWASRVDPREAMPALTLIGEGEAWRPQKDLLTSSRFAPAFVVESDDEGGARLRFGDGVLGRMPSPGTVFRAACRVGSGEAGNVGADSLTTIEPPIEGVTVRNPIAAAGGVAPESVRLARLRAPQAFRRQERAVTEADYAEAAQRHPDVQRAAATRRWTGSWHTVFVTIDRRGGRAVDAAFEDEMRAFLGRFRLAGHDLEIDAPRYVPLDVSIRLCVGTRAARGAVRQALHARFGTALRPDGTPGFFHPDRFTFGQPVVLSQLLSAALDVPGVDSVREVVRFQRQGDTPHGEIDRGFIAMHRLEIARLDNDPSRSEHGRIEFLLEGGL